MAAVIAGVSAGTAPVHAEGTDRIWTVGIRDAWNGQLSADGRRVAFLSADPKLTPGDVDDAPDVFLTDLDTDRVQVVSVSDAGAQASYGACDTPSISADGRYVAFHSVDPSLDPGLPADRPSTYLRDIRSGTTTRVSVTSQGRPLFAEPGTAVSADGRYVVFLAYPEVTDYSPGVELYRHDTRTGTTVLVSPSTTERALESVDSPSISADGRYVAFVSSRTGLVADDTNDTSDVFRRDVLARTTIRVSVTEDGGQLSSWSRHPTISADGSHVVFVSGDPRLDPAASPGDRPDEGTLYRHNVETGDNVWLADSDPSLPSISADGDRVAYLNQRPTGEEQPPEYRIQLREVETGRTRTVATGMEWSLGAWGWGSLSGDGRSVSYPVSTRSPSAPPDADLDATDVIVQDLRTGRERQVSLPVPGGCRWNPADLVTGVPAVDGGAGAVDTRFHIGADRTLSRNAVGAGTGRPGDRFGAAVAVTDLDASACASAVVGAPGVDRSGRVVVVFNSEQGPAGGRPTLVLAAPRGAPGDDFGAAVVVTHRRDADYQPVRGDVDLWVGAPGRDVAGHRDAGAIEHFRLRVEPTDPRSAPELSHVATLTQNSPGIPGAAESGDRFGAVLATLDLLPSDVDSPDPAPFPLAVAVGTPAEDIGRDVDAGSVTVLRTEPRTGQAMSSFALTQDSVGTSGVPEPGDRFGAAVAVGAKTLVVGVPGEDLGDVVDAGSVHRFGVFRSDFRQLWSGHLGGGRYLTVPGTPRAGDRFGAAVALRTELDEFGLVVGIPGRDVEGRADAGALFDSFHSNRLYRQGQGLSGTPEAGDRLGATLGFRGGVQSRRRGSSDLDYYLGEYEVLVGVPGEDLAGIRNAGMVHAVGIGKAFAETTVTMGSGPRSGARYGAVLPQDTAGL